MIVARGYITLTNIQGSANLLDWQSQWREGELPVGWSLNGVAAENSIVENTNPFATKSVMWKCTPNTVATNNGEAAGGFISPYVKLDNVHTYRYTAFVYREKASKGSIYHGCYGVNYLSGTVNTNPYFLVNAAPAGQWYLLVGHIHPSKADNTWQLSASGIYDMTGKKIVNATDYKLQEPNVDVRLRNYLFYTDNPEDVAYFYNPRLEVCDGNEMSIEQLLQISTREEIDAVKVEYKSEIQKLDNKIAFSVSEVKSYTDGKVTAEAQRATADAQAKADAARVAAEAVAVAKAELAKTTAQAYADGKVTAEEQRAIADAQAKLNEAKADATTKANAAQSAATAAAAVDATNKANNAQNNAITALTKDFKYPVGRFLTTATKGLFLFATKIPEKRNNMVCVNFDGYLYGNQNAFGVKLVFYTYTSLSNYGYIVTGADCVDRIRLGVKDGMVCIEMKFKQDVYYPGFIIDIAATMGTFPRSYSEGWIFTPDNIATGNLIDDTYTNVVVVPRKESFAETQAKAQFQILSDQIASKVSTESFNALGMRVSSAESTITQQAAQIATKVSQSTFDALGNRVTAAESSITQMPNKIALAVSTSEEKIKTSFTLDSTGISIIGKKIALTGVMTFSAFAPDAQSKVNNAQSTANTAVTKADAAQSTANSAVSKADTAQSGLNTLIGKLGDLSYEDMVGIAKLDTTIIEGGFIKTNLIDANAIITNSLLAQKIAATDITTSRLTATTGAMIGGWSVEGNSLITRAENGAKLLVEVSGTKFLRVNDLDTMLAIRSDGDRKTGISISTFGNSKALSITANGYGYAIESAGSHIMYQRSGEVWNTPGVLWAGRVSPNGGVQNYWGDGCSVSSANATAVGFYDIYHNLGRTDYFIMVTPTPYTVDGDQQMTAMIGNKFSNYFTVVLVDVGGRNRRCAFELAIIGRNRLQ